MAQHTQSCTVDGCTASVGLKAARGMCPRHYQRWLRTGSARRYCETCGSEVTRNRRFCSDDCKPRCTVEHCESPQRKRTWCASHYAQWQRTGEPPQPFTWKWHGPVTYSGVHMRLQVERGSASAHPCSHCADAASDWAYDHQDPDECSSEDGPYSLNPDRYMPLCRRCHRRFDRE